LTALADTYKNTVFKYITSDAIIFASDFKDAAINPVALATGCK